MEFTELIKVVFENGSAIAIIAYFLYKDWKTTDQIIATLQSIKEVLAELRTWHAVEDRADA